MNWETVTTLHDFLRPHMWHDPQGVEIDGDLIRLTAKPRRRGDVPVAGATVKSAGTGPGLLRYATSDIHQ